MLFFVCYQCQHVDSVELAFVADLPPNAADQRCTYCKTGTWHGRFDYEPYDPEHDHVCNRPTDYALG